LILPTESTRGNTYGINSQCAAGKRDEVARGRSTGPGIASMIYTRFRCTAAGCTPGLRRARPAGDDEAARTVLFAADLSRTWTQNARAS